ncbi:tetratricopeptide repeat protein 41-like [Haliotis asinina]|uniref:tetratricopeptide repeat protein 41-like n=1 Tax=Haliotis asinina TaxID=109174 RepID=UPI0035325477
MFEDFLDESPDPSTVPDTGKELKIRKPICPYICATPVDFEEELNFLAEKIYPRIVEFSLRRGAYFSPVDIRWKPDDSIIQNGQLLRLLLDYIHKCMPFLICLLGECYGPYRPDSSATLPKCFSGITESSPPLDRNYMVAASAGYEWVLEESHQNCSLTELEIIQAAFLGDSEHCSFYFRQAEHLDFKFADLSDNEKQAAVGMYREENELAGLKIADLKQRIVKKGLPVQYFKTPEELGSLVFNDWTSVVDMLYPPLEDFESFIDTEEYTEWMSQESFAENLRHKFIASSTSDAIMQHLTKFALSALDEVSMESEVETFSKYRAYSASSALRKRKEETSKRKSLMILLGERGSGKSALVAKWLKVFHEENPDMKVIHHFVGCSSHSTDITIFLTHCIKQLRSHFLSQDAWDDSSSPPQSVDNEDQPTSFLETCEAFLASASLGPCVLVLDGIDELGTSLGLTPQEVKEFLWLPSTLPQKCRIILTTTRSDLTFRNLSKRSDVQLISIPSITSDSHKMQLLQDSMKQHYSHISKSCLQQILDIKLACRPLFLSVLAAEMQCFHVYMKLEEFIEDNLEVCSVREFWIKCLQRWTSHYSWQLDSHSTEDDDKKEFEYVGWVCDALCLLALSRNGLSQIELMQLLRNIGYVGSLEVSHYDWLQFRSCLGSSVYDRPDGLIVFSHQHLKEIVEYVVLRIVKSSSSDVCQKSELETEWVEKKRKLHNHLAEYFHDQPHSQRKLQELPWQLMMAGDHEALLGFVTHIDYLLDLLDEKGKFPGNRHDLKMYWVFLSRVGLDVDNTYSQLLVRIGLLESSLKVLQPVMMTEVPDDSDSEDARSVETPDPRRSTALRTPTPRCQQLSVIEEGYSETEERFSQQSEVQKDEETICISDKGLVTSLAWHIGQFLLELGHAETTKQILTGLLQYFIRNYPLSCRELKVMAECHEMLGNIHHSRDDMRNCEGSYRRALRIVIDLIEKNDEDTDLTSLQVLKGRLLGHHGSLRLSEGELGEAEDLLKESLESIENCPGHITLRATVLFHLGILRHKQQDCLRAESCLRQCLILREQWFGKRHPLVADVLVALARLLSSTSNNKGCDKAQAEHLYSRAIEVREQCLTSNHLLTAEILYELGCLIGEQPSYSAKMESITLLRKALDIRTTRLGGDHPDTKAAQQYLTNQEVMLRLGHYEFGPAKPTDTRTPSNPYSSLSFRDKDLSALKKKFRPSTTINRLRNGDRDSVRSVSREDLLKHNRPLSIMGSSASVMSASERLLTDSDRPKLLRRGSIERRFQQALDMGKTVPLSETNASSLTSDSSIRRLTVDLSFAGGGDDDGDDAKRPSVTISEPQIDNYASEMAAEPQKSPKKVPVKAKVDSRPVSAPLKLFALYGKAGNVRLSMPNRTHSANFNRGDGSGIYTTGTSSSCLTNSSLQSHRSRCSIPGPHAINVSNCRSISGPHSSIYSLLDKPSIPWDMKRAVHHKAAWYHVKGRYPTNEEPIPSKRSQSRPNSVSSSSSRVNTNINGLKQKESVSRKHMGKIVMAQRSEPILVETHPSQDSQPREAIRESVALNCAVVSFKPETAVVT